MGTTFSPDNKGSGYIAFFDLDRTITKAVSGRALARHSFRKGHMKMSDLIEALLLGMGYRLGIADPVSSMIKMTEWLGGMKPEVLAGLCHEVVHKMMIPSIYSNITDELKMHRSRNARTVILSSSLEPVCREMADFLNMDDIICSRLEVADGYLTGRPDGKLCYGEEKGIRLKEYCEINNSRTDEAWYYGDSEADIPALSLAGIPVCINPEKKLRKAALKNNWKIYFWD